MLSNCVERQHVFADMICRCISARSPPRSVIQIFSDLRSLSFTPGSVSLCTAARSVRKEETVSSGEQFIILLIIYLILLSYGNVEYSAAASTLTNNGSTDYCDRPGVEFQCIVFSFCSTQYTWLNDKLNLYKVQLHTNILFNKPKFSMEQHLWEQETKSCYFLLDSHHINIMCCS